MSGKLARVYSMTERLPKVERLMTLAPEADITIWRKPSSRTVFHVTWPSVAVIGEVLDEGRKHAALLTAAETVGPVTGIASVIRFEIDPDFDDDGRVAGFASELVRELGGFWFDGDRYRDADGDLPPAESAPPTAHRVAIRLLSLAAVVARANIEQLPREEALPLAADLIRWVLANHLLDEMEPHERNFVSSELGTPESQSVIDGSWRAEGVAVLAWALGLAELPPHDQLVDLTELFSRIDFGEDKRSSVLENPILRPEEELYWMNARLLGMHWRLNEFRLHPLGMDFAAFSRDCWFGSFDLTGIQLIETDLAVAGQSVAKAPADRVDQTGSIAVERHRAINWLCGWAELFSQVDVST